MFSNETAANKLTSPHALALVTTQSADDAYSAVLAGAGAMPWNRDATDLRMVGDVRNGTGALVDAQHAAEWNALLNAIMVSRPAGWDTDNDGMPNAWETANGFNPNLADHNLVQGDGYTALEHYVNSIVAVPEPASLTALVLAGSLLTRRRRWR
jgi:hypothetical protein